MLAPPGSIIQPLSLQQNRERPPANEDRTRGENALDKPAAIYFNRNPVQFFNPLTPKTVMPIDAPDLTKRPPRSARVRLGGYVILPRMLDKGRALIAGKIGEYKYACPLDERFLNFAGINPAALKKQLASGKGDREILAWITAQSKPKRTDAEIATWSCLGEQRVPSDTESRAYFNDLHTKIAPKREDMATWFDLLDVDDYVSFGGKP